MRATQLFFLLFLCSIGLFSQTNIKNYEGQWEGILKDQKIFNFKISLKEKNDNTYDFNIYNTNFKIHKVVSSSEKKYIQFNIDKHSSFKGVKNKDNSEINGFIDSGIYLYHVKLRKDNQNTYTGHWNIFMLDELLSKKIYLSIENVNSKSFDAFPFFGDKRFAGTWCMNSQKKGNIISFQDFRTGLHFRGQLLDNKILLKVLYSNVPITSILLKKSTKEWTFGNYSKVKQKIIINDDWKIAPPKKSFNLTSLEDSINSKVIPKIHSIVIAKNNRLIYEKYFSGFNANIPHDQRSASKSITSTLTGIAIDKKLLKDESTYLYNYLPNKYNYTRDSLKSKISLKNLLTMSSGLDVLSKASEQNYQNSKDWLKTVLEAPMVSSPGTKAHYGSANPYLLGIALQKIISKPLDLYIDQNLFQHLNITNYAIQKDMTGKPYFAGGMYITPRDMLKLGQLYLQEGKWKGKQIISKNWISKSFATYHRLQNVKDKNQYGYLWWKNIYTVDKKQIKSFEARGNGGQYIFVLPQLNSVCVITAGNYNSNKTQLPEHLFKKYILPKLTN